MHVAGILDKMGSGDMLRLLRTGPPRSSASASEMLRWYKEVERSGPCRLQVTSRAADDTTTTHVPDGLHGVYLVQYTFLAGGGIRLATSMAAKNRRLNYLEPRLLSIQAAHPDASLSASCNQIYGCGIGFYTDWSSPIATARDIAARVQFDFSGLGAEDVSRVQLGFEAQLVMCVHRNKAAQFFLPVHVEEGERVMVIGFCGLVVKSTNPSCSPILIGGSPYYHTTGKVNVACPACREHCKVGLRILHAGNSPHAVQAALKADLASRHDSVRTS